MRLQIPIIVAFSLFALLLFVVVQPVQANRNVFAIGEEAIPASLPNFSARATITSTVTPTNSPSSTESLTGTIGVTVTPTITPGSMQMPSPSPSITTGQSSLIYIPAFIDLEQTGGTGDPTDPCGIIQSPLPTTTVEPTSTPAPTVTTTTPITASVSITLPTTVLTSTVCPPNAQEIELTDLLINTPAQQRPSMVYNPILAQVAKNHALDMAIRGFFGPVNPDGNGPNHRVRQGGYVLPDHYGQELGDNNVETIMAGYSLAADVAEMLARDSNLHAFGAHEGYRNQDEYGIGYVYVEGSIHGHYWVIVIAESGESNESRH